jgi:hypothetical protein
VDPLGLDGQCLGNENCGGSGWAGGGIDVPALIDAIGRAFAGGGGGSAGAPSSNAQSPGTSPSPAATMIPTFAANALSTAGGVWYGQVHIPGTGASTGGRLVVIDASFACQTHPSAKIDRPTNETNGDSSKAIPPLVAPLGAEGEEHDAAARPTGAAASATTLLDALDAEAAEEDEDDPLEGQSCFDDRAPRE